MRDPMWVAWRTGRDGFSLWHRSYDPEHHWTCCGRTVDGIVSVRVTAPKVEQECDSCRLKDSLRVRKMHAVPKRA